MYPWGEGAQNIPAFSKSEIHYLSDKDISDFENLKGLSLINERSELYQKNKWSKPFSFWEAVYHAMSEKNKSIMRYKKYFLIKIDGAHFGRGLYAYDLNNKDELKELLQLFRIMKDEDVDNTWFGRARWKMEYDHRDNVSRFPADMHRRLVAGNPS